MECEKPLPLTEFDRVTVSESTQMIKAVIPFLDTSTKKTISIFIRFQELMQTIDFFKKPLHTESTSSFNRPNYSMKDILFETMPYFSKSTEDTLNTFQNFMEMFNVINMYKDMDQSQDFQSIINMVKTMNDTTTSDAFKNMGMDSGSDYNNSDSNMKDNINSYNNDNVNTTMNNSDTKSNDNINTNMNDNINTNLNNMKDTGSPFSNLMSEDQKKLYDKFLSDIENIDFDNYTSNELNL